MWGTEKNPEKSNYKMYIRSYRDKVKAELLLNAKETKNSNAGKTKGNFEITYLPVIGDYQVSCHAFFHLEIFKYISQENGSN